LPFSALATNYWAQATAANQPAYTANALNGKHGLTFDGSKSELALWAAANATTAVNESALHPVGGWLFAAVWQTQTTSSSGTGSRPALYSAQSAYSIYEFSSTGPSAVIRNYDGATSVEVAVTIATSTNYASMWWYDGTNLKNQLGNGTPASSACGSESDVVHQPNMGANYNSTVLFKGLVYEMVVCNAVPTAAQRSQLLNYLKAGWGV